MFPTSIAGSLPKPPWLAEPGKLWAPWRPVGAELEAAKLDAAPPTDLPSLMAAFRKLLPGNVWAATLYPADEGVAPDATDLVHAGPGADVREILDRHVSPQRGHVAKDRVVADVVAKSIGTSVVDTVNDDVEFGLRMFPSAQADVCTDNDDPEVAPAQDTEITIIRYLLSNSATGFTPISSSASICVGGITASPASTAR